MLLINIDPRILNKILANWILQFPIFQVNSLPSAAAAAKSLQSCPTLCEPIDGSPPGFTIPGILQARTLEWVAISFSDAWKWKVNVKSLSRVRLFTTPWTEAYQAPLSVGFSRQETCDSFLIFHVSVEAYKTWCIANRIYDSRKVRR